MGYLFVLIDPVKDPIRVIRLDKGKTLFCVLKENNNYPFYVDDTHLLLGNNDNGYDILDLSTLDRRTVLKDVYDLTRSPDRKTIFVKYDWGRQAPMEWDFFYPGTGRKVHNSAHLEARFFGEFSDDGSHFLLRYDNCVYNAHSGQLLDLR